ncbi:MAG TPA: hypothetical protein DHK64_08580, partial [Rhodobiaceae bacterium]|nr:hypothetical protein [Rhodobiaceae bacterium]
ALKGDILVVTREVAAALKSPSLSLKQGGQGLWDERFHVSLVKAPRGQPVEVRALGAEGLAALRAAKTALPAVPSAVLQALPGLWQSDELLAAPQLGTLRPGVEAHVSLGRTLPR